MFERLRAQSHSILNYWSQKALEYFQTRSNSNKSSSLGISHLITLTDPPLLNYWVARLCRRRRIPWIYWSMDLYPEAFAAAGLAKPGGVLYRHFKKELLRSTPALRSCSMG